MSLQIDRTLDFVTRLRTGKRSLQLLLDGITREDLERFHFADGQEVRVQLTDERLEIRLRRDVHDVQKGVGDYASQLRDMAGGLRTLRSHLPGFSGDSGPEELAGVEAEVAAAIECVLVDEIDPAAERLEAAARLSSDRSGGVR